MSIVILEGFAQICRAQERLASHGELTQSDQSKADRGASSGLSSSGEVTILMTDTPVCKDKETVASDRGQGTQHLGHLALSCPRLSRLSGFVATEYAAVVALLKHRGFRKVPALVACVEHVEDPA